MPAEVATICAAPAPTAVIEPVVASTVATAGGHARTRSVAHDALVNVVSPCIAVFGNFSRHCGSPDRYRLSHGGLTARHPYLPRSTASTPQVTYGNAVGASSRVAPRANGREAVLIAVVG